MSYRRQKRWWNSYILFYERNDAFQSEDEKDLTKSMQDLTIGNFELLLHILKTSGKKHFTL